MSRILTHPDCKKNLIVLPCFIVSTDLFKVDENRICKGFILCDVRDLSDDEADAFRLQARKRWREAVSKEPSNTSKKDPSHGYSLETLEEMSKADKRRRSRCRMTLEIAERKSDFSRIVT